MPRDATETRNRLRREAERLFARRGVYEATLREITEAAGQRNVSALNYHFGSREGIVQAILEYHGDPLDEVLRNVLETLAPDDVQDVDSPPLVDPPVSKLASAGCRQSPKSGFSPVIPYASGCK